MERGRFDGLFIADVLGIYDVLNGNGDAAIRHATQVPVNDPLALITPMALVTEHLGFGLTASLSFEHPYSFARRLSTLDHLTKGRVGWNIVTSYLESGARNIGQQAQGDHDHRYDYGDEYMQVVYKLLEGSWEADAVLRDRQRGIFSDPDKIHPIHHQGKFFNVPGIHLCEPSPQRTPVLYQAGASSRGKVFAAEHAECVFVASPSKVLRATDSLQDAYEAHVSDDETLLTDCNVRAEAEAGQAQVISSELVPWAATLLFNALGASDTRVSKALDRHWRNARTLASHNPVIYKARDVGNWRVNGVAPTGIWQIGNATA